MRWNVLIRLVFIQAAGADRCNACSQYNRIKVTELISSVICKSSFKSSNPVNWPSPYKLLTLRNTSKISPSSFSCTVYCAIRAYHARIILPKRCKLVTWFTSIDSENQIICFCRSLRITRCRCYRQTLRLSSLLHKLMRFELESIWFDIQFEKCVRTRYDTIHNINCRRVWAVTTGEAANQYWNKNLIKNMSYVCLKWNRLPPLPQILTPWLCPCSLDHKNKATRTQHLRFRPPEKTQTNASCCLKPKT
jgi:hypothetical protein